MPLQLVGWLEGLIWIPDGDAGNSALVWSMLVVAVGGVSFRNEAQAIGDGSCAKFARAQERNDAQDDGPPADDEAKPSGHTPAPGRIDTRGGMMLIYMCPLCVHIVAWDFSFRIRNMLGAAAFEGTPMQDWEPPTLTLYHYLLIVLIALHFTRRFAESLMLHVYSSDISYTTVATLGLQFSADVLLLDYYILNTPLDLEKDSVWGVNVYIWVGMFLYSSQFCLPFALHSPLASELTLRSWLTGQLGCVRHHGLLRGLREEADDGQSQRATTSGAYIAASSGKRKRAERKAARRSNKGDARASSTSDRADDEASKCVLGYLSPASLGGGFEQCCCPHYAYEILCWVGLALIGRHVFFWCGLCLQLANHLSVDCLGRFECVLNCSTCTEQGSGAACVFIVGKTLRN